MGFLTQYNQTDTVALGDDWWVKVRKHLRRGEYRAAQTVLVSPVMRFRSGDETKGEASETETRGDIDTVGYQNELLFGAIVDWNLTDENEEPLPLAPEAAKRRSIDLLPEDVFEKLLEVIQPKSAPKGKEGEQNGVTPFPAGGSEVVVAGRRSSR